jgi:hypothetical protein
MLSDDKNLKELLNKDKDEVLSEVRSRIHAILSLIADHVERYEFDEALILLVSLLSFVTFLLCIRNDHYDELANYKAMVISIYENLLNALVEDVQQGHLQIN